MERTQTRFPFVLRNTSCPLFFQSLSIILFLSLLSSSRFFSFLLIFLDFCLPLSLSRFVFFFFFSLSSFSLFLSFYPSSTLRAWLLKHYLRDVRLKDSALRWSNSDNVTNHVKREVNAVDGCSCGARCAALKLHMDTANATNDNCLAANLPLGHVHMKCAQMRLRRTNHEALVTLKAGG